MLKKALLVIVFFLGWQTISAQYSFYIGGSLAKMRIRNRFTTFNRSNGFKGFRPLPGLYFYGGYQYQILDDGFIEYGLGLHRNGYAYDYDQGGVKKENTLKLFYLSIPITYMHRIYLAENLYLAGKAGLYYSQILGGRRKQVTNGNEENIDLTFGVDKGVNDYYFFDTGFILAAGVEYHDIRFFFQYQRGLVDVSLERDYGHEEHNRLFLLTVGLGL